MKKDILTELKDGMQEMKEEEMKKVADALYAGNVPPIPMTPIKVMKKVYQIARHHKMTVDEFATLLELQGTAGTAEAVEMLEAYKQQLAEEEA